MPDYSLTFSHMGYFVRDLEKMASFYCDVLGFYQTDRGMLGPRELRFFSRNPKEHHQIVLMTGRSADQATTINQISFRVGSLQGLRELHGVFQSENVQSIFPANHGIAWSMYVHDPEGNNLEFFVDTDWYFPQPFLIPLAWAAIASPVVPSTSETPAAVANAQASAAASGTVKSIATSHSAAASASSFFWLTTKVSGIGKVRGSIDGPPPSKVDGSPAAMILLAQVIPFAVNAVARFAEP